MKISVVSGGFDPLHSGHLEYLQSAKDGSDKLIVLLNSDEWLSNKKGKPFLPVSERKLILESIKYVDEVILFDDDDKGSCINGLKKVISLNPDDEIIFCNGGDRNKSNIPEMELTEINFKFGVGGGKKCPGFLVLYFVSLFLVWAVMESSRIFSKMFSCV